MVKTSQPKLKANVQPGQSQTCVYSCVYDIKLLHKFNIFFQPPTFKNLFLVVKTSQPKLKANVQPGQSQTCVYSCVYDIKLLHKFKSLFQLPTFINLFLVVKTSQPKPEANVKPDQSESCTCIVKFCDIKQLSKLDMSFSCTNLYKILICF